MSRYPSSPQYLTENYPYGGGESQAKFFKPSYLIGSKYLEQLEESHNARLAAAQDEPPARSSNPGSLSTSSSSLSLHKMAPSHRGMTYDIIEHQPHVEDDSPSPLPSKWKDLNQYSGLEISDGLDVKYVGQHKLGDSEAAATRADNPIPRECGIYYFEVNIISKGKEGMIGVGYSAAHVSLEKLPGWEQDSWAYHGDDGKSFCCQSSGKGYGPTFTSGDVIGCGINFLTGCGFFTKNGVFLGKGNHEALATSADSKQVMLFGISRESRHILRLE